MDCKEAPACRRALNEATALYPRRYRASDGICGDVAHRLRASDHNPSWVASAFGYACAFDLTHDPAHGCDAHAMVRGLAERLDPRAKYIISQGRIWSPDRGWRLYFGINRHDRHAHVSIYPWAAFDAKPWWQAPPESAPGAPPESAPGVPARPIVDLEEEDGMNPRRRVASWGGGRTDVFAIAGDSPGPLMQCFFDGENWNGEWIDLGGTVHEILAIRSDRVGHYDIYIIGDEGVIYHKWILEPGPWSEWLTLGTP